MEHRPEEVKVKYFSKDRKKKSCDATEWLAAVGSHVPERGQFVLEGPRTTNSPLRRTTAPRCLPPTGCVDTACSDPGA
jgi:hypothetical protein